MDFEFWQLKYDVTHMKILTRICNILYIYISSISFCIIMRQIVHFIHFYLYIGETHNSVLKVYNIYIFYIVVL